MRIEVKKVTDESLMREACEFTMFNKFASKQTLETMYKCRHSPMRTQIFVVKMYAIPTSASVHFVRHSAVGQQHYVTSNRPDRNKGGYEGVSRDTPIDHMMILNAQHLEEIAWRRLCKKAEKPTREVMEAIRSAVMLVDEELASRMVPHCVYLGRCDEENPCRTL